MRALRRVEHETSVGRMEVNQSSEVDVEVGRINASKVVRRELEQSLGLVSVLMSDRCVHNVNCNI